MMVYFLWSARVFGSDNPLYTSLTFYILKHLVQVWLMKFFITIIFMMTWGSAKAEEHNVGIHRIAVEVAGTEVPVRIFYPTREKAIETQFGPWRLLAASNALLTQGEFPLVVVSHGLGGNDWNHHLLASSLVKAGFVVAAVRHPDDFLRVSQAEITVLRPNELVAAINAVLNNTRFGSSIDAERIGAFGFSLGGFTALAAAGGRVDITKIPLHCANAANDPEFCIGEEGGDCLPIWLRAKRLIYTIPKVDLAQDVRSKNQSCRCRCPGRVII